MRTPKERIEYAVNGILIHIQKLGRVNGRISLEEEIKIKEAVDEKLQQAFQLIRERNLSFKFHE
jgi:DNA-binding TFAR19-related protein (PDSD5 family)